MKVRITKDALFEDNRFVKAGTEIDVTDMNKLNEAYKRAQIAARTPAQAVAAPSLDQQYQAELARLNRLVTQLSNEVQTLKLVSQRVEATPLEATQKLATLIQGFSNAEKLADMRATADTLKEWADEQISQS